MRCQCCNVLLNDFESTRKSDTTGEYLDVCNKCFVGLGLSSIDRGDLEPNAQPEGWEDEDFEMDSEYYDDYGYGDERD